jgi:hypothetical protein
MRRVLWPRSQQVLRFRFARIQGLIGSGHGCFAGQGIQAFGWQRQTRSPQANPCRTRTRSGTPPVVAQNSRRYPGLPCAPPNPAGGVCVRAGGLSRRWRAVIPFHNMTTTATGTCTGTSCLFVQWIQHYATRSIDGNIMNDQIIL